MNFTNGDLFFVAVVLSSVLIATARAGALEFEMVATSAETYARPHDIVLSPDGKAFSIDRKALRFGTLISGSRTRTTTASYATACPA